MSEQKEVTPGNIALAWSSGGSGEFASTGISDSTDPSTECKAKQRALILDWLREGPLSTVQAREDLGILHPAGRVSELRKEGYRIATTSGSRWDRWGRPHRVAVYRLEGGAA